MRAPAPSLMLGKYSSCTRFTRNSIPTSVKPDIFEVHVKNSDFKRTELLAALRNRVRFSLRISPVRVEDEAVAMHCVEKVRKLAKNEYCTLPNSEVTRPLIILEQGKCKQQQQQQQHRR